MHDLILAAMVFEMLIISDIDLFCDQCCIGGNAKNASANR